ncbi:MAG TPA: DUF5709 domain-containing protein [Streptosporangiaceae bacterium]|nr:DUF5709 domain-containing protein [Streptosporangiaceae bacterium]
MTDERRHESADLEDYDVQDGSDSLDGNPGDDPLDRGVVPPERWSAAMRYGTTAAEQEDGESLDQRLDEEEPDSLGFDGDPDPRAGRLAAGDETSDPAQEDDLEGLDEGIDGGGATAEEAAVHVVDDDRRSAE